MAEGKMGAEGVYSEAKVQLASNAVATEGTHEAGWLAAGIGRNTFYTWLKKRPEFKEAIRTAEDEFRASQRANVKRLGYQAYLGYLRGDMTKVTHTKKEIVNPVNGQIEQVEEWKTVPCGVPEWAVRRALDSMSELQGLQALAEEGLIEKSVVAIAERILEEAKDKIRMLIKGQLPQELHRQLEVSKESGITKDTYAAIRKALRGTLSEETPLKSDRTLPPGVGPKIDLSTNKTQKVSQNVPRS